MKQIVRVHECFRILYYGENNPSDMNGDQWEAFEIGIKIMEEVEM